MEMSNAEIRRHELLDFICETATQLLIEYNVPADHAGQAGNALADALAKTWGGQIVTFPKDYFRNLHRRDLEIYEEFDGRNHGHLARKHNLTVRAIYNVIKRVRENGDPNQPQLF